MTYANVMATVAVFIALGGTSVAALRISSRQIVNNSVRSGDIRNNDVRSGDIRNGAVAGADVRDNDLSGRDVRDRSLSGADLARESIGSAEVSGLQTGDFAPGVLPDPLPSVLPSGKTLKGTFGAAVTGVPSGPLDRIARTPISFPVPISFVPRSSDKTLWYIQEGTSPPPECPGSASDPQAARGVFCIYEADSIGSSTARGVFDPVSGNNFWSSRFGAVAFINGDAGAAIRGTWAVTAP
jgi:hypothetical protein